MPLVSDIGKIMNTRNASILLATTLLAWSPCRAQNAASATTPAGVLPTSFAEVTRQLDPGGTLYGYLATERWLAGLSTNLIELERLLLGLPGLGTTSEREQVEGVFKAVRGVVNASGLESVSGVGISSLQLTSELFRTKFVVHRRPGADAGLLWTVPGRQPHRLQGLDLLPDHTALAAFGDVDVRTLWQVLDRELRQCGVPAVAEWAAGWPDLFERETQIPWTKLLGSLGGELGFALTLDDSRRIKLPIPGLEVETGMPGLLVAIRVTDDTLYTRISTHLKQNPETQETTDPSFKLCTMPVPMPIPIPIEITVASGGGYCFLASSADLARAALAVREGRKPGLRGAAELKPLLAHLPAEGNNFAFMSRRLGDTFRKIQQQMVKAGGLPPGSTAVIQAWMAGQDPAYGLSVGSATPTGWLDVSVGNQDSAAAVLLLPVAPVAISAGMLLPALANAKTKAQSINCVNNLKQVGLAFRIWSTDNEDHFPFHVRSSKGGSLESCDQGPDGFDRNAYRHFQVLSNELATPKILVCVADSSRQPAPNFAALQAGNVSYQLRSGPDVDETHPGAVLARCPIHGHEVLCDGSVRQGSRR
jgi:hypothetical protein